MFSGKVEVAPANIRGELAAIWNKTASDDARQAQAQDKSSETTRIRATLSNIIILLPPVPDKESLASVDSLIESLCIAHPSRFFVIDMLEPDAKGASLRTAVSSRCVLASSGSHVCSEEIYISSKPEAAQHVPNLILSNLVPDVAADFLLIGNPLITDCPQEDERVLQLIGASDRMSDRVIFDSSQFEDFGRCLDALLSQYDVGEGSSSFGVSGIYGKGNFKFRDVNWRRLRRWRALVREQFEIERVSERTSELSSIEIVTCNSNASARVGADAALIGAWIARCLEFDFGDASTDGSTISLKLRGAEVQACLKFKAASDQGFRDGEMLEIRFLLGPDVGGLVLSLRRSVDDRSLVVSVEADATSEFVRRVPFLENSLEELVLDDVVSISASNVNLQFHHPNGKLRVKLRLD